MKESESFRQRLSREYNEHFRGNLLYIFLIFIIVSFSMGYFIGSVWTTGVLGKTAFNVLEQAGLTQNIESVVEQCIRHVGF